MILFKRQIDKLVFIGFLGFSINTKLCLLFPVDGEKFEYSIMLKYQKHKSKELPF